MQILDSSVSMRGAHEATRTYSRTERLLIWRGERPNTEGQATTRATPAVANPAAAARPAAIVELSDEAVRRATECRCAHEADELERELDPREDFKARLLAKTLEYLTGMKVVFTSPGEILRDRDRAAEEAGRAAGELARTGEGRREQEARPERPDWGMEYDLHEVRTESEKTTFQADATVKTKDGQTLNVKVNLTMARELAEERNVSIRAGNARKVDPLVINFDGNAAQLGDRTFDFDLDSDGAAEKIAFVQPGSGFLTLDLNGNGAVDDGSELFGPTSGNGFQELAAYDEDGNHWIDEGDSVFDRLRIWTRDASGADSLSGLLDKGVGAIYLGSVATPFELKGSDQQTLGEVASSGIYLKEQGGVGTVQQVDLVAEELPAPQVAEATTEAAPSTTEAAAA